MELSTDIWVAALIRRATLGGAFATVVRRGDARGGAVLVKTRHGRAAEVRLWAQALGARGDPVWMQPLTEADEVAVDAYLDRAVARDPDLWVIEIEDADGARFLTEDVEGR
ncbi:MAG: DUF1491 family protein [Alphaproteobacteria bacterium]|nr:DUF1491 family protein [Alphaproteobacteria bacterium]